MIDMKERILKATDVFLDDIDEKQAQHIIGFIIMLIEEERDTVKLSAQLDKIEAKFIKNIEVNYDKLQTYCLKDTHPKWNNLHPKYQKNSGERLNNEFSLFVLALIKNNLFVITSILHKINPEKIGVVEIGYVFECGNVEVLKLFDKFAVNFDEYYEAGFRQPCNILQFSLLRNRFDLFEFFYQKDKSLFKQYFYADPKVSGDVFDTISFALLEGNYRAIKYLLENNLIEPADLNSANIKSSRYLDQRLIPLGHRFRAIKSFDILSYVCNFETLDNILATIVQLLILGISFNGKHQEEFLELLDNLPVDQPQFCLQLLKILKKVKAYENFSVELKSQIEGKMSNIEQQKSTKLLSLKDQCVHYIAHHSFFTNQHILKLPAELQENFFILSEILPKNILPMLHDHISVTFKTNQKEKAIELQKTFDTVVENLKRTDHLDFFSMVLSNQNGLKEEMMVEDSSLKMKV